MKDLLNNTNSIQGVRNDLIGNFSLQLSLAKEIMQKEGLINQIISQFSLSTIFKPRASWQGGGILPNQLSYIH